MMQLLCNGVYLDLAENTKLQFKETNPLFAFDNMACERTTEFHLPHTPQNDRVFSLARIPATDGVGMRQRYAAQLQASGVTKDGYLYISNDSGKEYTAIFVTGELLGLKAIRDLGNMNECGVFDSYTDTVVALQNGSTGAGGDSATTAKDTLWANVYYMRDGNLHPSIQITKLLQAMGVTDSSGILDSLYLRWIPKDPKPVQDEYLLYDVSLKNVSGAYVPDGAGYANNVAYFSLESVGGQGYFDDAFFSYPRVLIGYTSGSTGYKGYLREYRTKYETTLNFSASVTSEYFIGYFDEQTPLTQKYVSLSDFHFLGGYSFDVNGNVSGTPLGGRYVIIPANTLFVLIKKSWYSTSGWNVSGSDFELHYNAVAFTQFRSNPPAIWRLKDNLPNCTAIDFLKAAAAMTGSVLRYTDAQGVFFDSDILNGDVIDISDKVLSAGAVARKFSDYEQHNIVQFAEDASLYNDEIVKVDYTINNANLKERKTLLTLPASNGGLVGANRVMVRGEEMSADTFARYNSNESVYLARATLSKNSGIQALCDASTSYVITARMSLVEFFSVKEKTQLVVNGNLYMWTERTWQDDVVQLTLAKLV